jgi:hypothetical protein
MFISKEEIVYLFRLSVIIVENHLCVVKIFIIFVHIVIFFILLFNI